MKTKLVNKPIHNNFVNELLKERGLTDEELDYFLNVPDDSALQDPTALDNIDEACQMFDKMINLGADDRICLIVDCDVDGFTSAAIFMKYYRHYNEDTNVMPIFHEGKGHGLADTYETMSLPGWPLKKCLRELASFHSQASSSIGYFATKYCLISSLVIS